MNSFTVVRQNLPLKNFRTTYLPLLVNVMQEWPFCRRETKGLTFIRAGHRQETFRITMARTFDAVPTSCRYASCKIKSLLLCICTTPRWQLCAALMSWVRRWVELVVYKKIQSFLSYLQKIAKSFSKSFQHICRWWVTISQRFNNNSSIYWIFQ